MLPVEILHYISATFLPSDAAASLALCSHSMLKALGGQALHSLALKCDTIERTRFLKNLEKDLPDWLLCHHCAKFHPVDQGGDLTQLWRPSDETECVRACGKVSIGHEFYIRYEHAQLIMRDYRLRRPCETMLKRLSNRFARSLLEASLEGVLTAKIVACNLLLQITYTLRLLEDWDISLIRHTIPKLCPHLVDHTDDDSIFAQALQCRLSHVNDFLCIECRNKKHCRKCTTSFQMDIRKREDLATEVQVDVWRCLGPCDSPFDSEWSFHADPYLRNISRKRERRVDSRSTWGTFRMFMAIGENHDQVTTGRIFPTSGATDEELAKWCKSI